MIASAVGFRRRVSALSYRLSAVSQVVERADEAPAER
jgi:hypothetical protein